MLSQFLIICFATSLLVTTSAVPTKHSRSLLTPSDVTLSTLSIPSLPAVLSAKNLTTRRRPGCWPNIHPITNPADCDQATLNMLLEGPDQDEPVVWDRDRGWIYRSCVLYLITSWDARVLPIHRGTFSRKDIAECAEKIQMDCVTEEQEYRGGKIPIDTGVFEVALAARPVQLSLEDWEEGIRLNKTAFE